MSKSLKSFINEEPSTAPAPSDASQAELTPDSAEIALDPRLEKEIWIDSFEINGKLVVIKSLGLGVTKPVVVYIDDKRWEVFPGPKIAKKEARRHIKKGNIKKENLEYNFESLLKEESDTKYKITKWFNKHKRKFDNGTEAAFAIAKEFDIEDEMENQKHWVWDIIKKTFKESNELSFFNIIESNKFKLLDNTKVEISSKLSNNIKNVYNVLTETNKCRFRNAFIINKENHNKIINFVKKQIKGI